MKIPKGQIRGSISYVIREMPIKPKCDATTYSLERPTFQLLTTPNTAGHVAHWEPIHH